MRHANRFYGLFCLKAHFLPGLLSLAIALLPACGAPGPDVASPSAAAPTAAVTLPPPTNAGPTPSPSLSRPTATARTPEPTPVQQEPGEEKRVMLTAEPTLTPAFPDLPDLAPPADGWIAFETPEEQLALISPDGSRQARVIKEGKVRGFAWSPDGRSLAFVRNGQLTILSIEDARFTPLTPPGAIRSTGLTWSQDSRHLAYLYSLEKEGRPVAPDALRLLDVAAREAITVSSYANTRPDERAVLCPQPFPFPLLAVKEAGFSRSVRMWNVRDREVLAELYPPSFGCGYLWLPDMPGVIFAREEAEKPGIEWTCPEDTQDCIKGETRISYPTSVIVWQMGKDPAGGEATTVVLEGTQKLHYHPTRWLPDGRLEVQVMQFEKTAYENRVQPQRVTYRYLVPTEDGTLREAESSDLPWWAAGGFEERFRATDLYREQNGERLVVPGWEVGPDGETVAFAWSRQAGTEEWESAIYLWQGVGEPRYLTAGLYPQWQ
jgi:hypothetical protein